MGGQDLNYGLYNSIWRISLQAIRDKIHEASWELIQARGDPPKGCSHCCMFVFQGKIFLFGGSRETTPAVKRYKKNAEEGIQDAKKPLLFNVMSL